MTLKSKPPFSSRPKPDQSRFNPGAVLAKRYRIVSLLGRGGMGEVYRADDLKLGQPVALKLLPEAVHDDAERQRRFLNEVKVALKVTHPNVCRVYDIGEVEGRHYLSMEYVDGEDLSSLLRRIGRLPGDKAVEIAHQLCAGLAAAHAEGILHRDLKPANVMIDGRGRAKITDFGLAGLAEEIVGEDIRAGTPDYMAPEQAAGREVSVKSDLYSLGLVLYELFTGERAFEAKTPQEKEQPEPPSSAHPAVPAELERVIHKCLEKEPDDRYQHADEIVVDLRQMISSSGERAVREPRIERWRATRWALPAFSLLLLVVAVAAITLKWLREPAQPAASPEVAKPSVAVLPFQNLSPEPGNEYFSDGITEEIISKLSRIGSLEVASRTSVTRYKETQQDVKTIGEELGVRYVLEGSVRKAGDQARITAQLVAVTTGFHLWSEDFDVELENIFEVQEQTALEIAQALDLQLSPQEQHEVRRSSTTSPQAFDAYLRGRALVEHFSDPEKLDAARVHFERALELDPDYPAALVGLARIEIQYDRNIDASPKRQERAEELARRALGLEPDLAGAHLVLGHIQGNRYDYAQAVESFREALRIDPNNADAWDLVSWALAYSQPPDATGAEEAARKAIELQPSLVGAFYHLGRALLLQQRYDEAIAAFEHTLVLDNKLEAASYGLGQVYLERGDPDRALAEFDKLSKNRRSPVRLFAAASAYARKGEVDKALEVLAAALEAGYRDFAALDASTHFDSLRSDPRFDELVRRHRAAQ